MNELAKQAGDDSQMPGLAEDLQERISKKYKGPG